MKIHQAAIQKIHQQALKAYPNEACGLLGTDGEFLYPWKAKNSQEDLRKIDPREFELDARHAFLITPEDEAQIEKEMKKVGQQQIGWYHSHPNDVAYLSSEDKERYWSKEDSAEAKQFKGRPPYTEALFLVIGVPEKKFSGYKFFAWKKGDFREIDIPVL